MPPPPGYNYMIDTNLLLDRHRINIVIVLCMFLGIYSMFGDSLMLHPEICCLSIHYHWDSDFSFQRWEHIHSSARVGSAGLVESQMLSSNQSGVLCISCTEGPNMIEPSNVKVRPKERRSYLTFLRICLSFCIISSWSSACWLMLYRVRPYSRR